MKYYSPKLSLPVISRQSGRAVQRFSGAHLVDADQLSRKVDTVRDGSSIPFARNSAFSPFVEFLNAIGAPAESLLQRARISTDPLNHPESLVPLYAVYRFFELAARHERLQNLGSIVGQRASSFDLGAYGLALRGTSTVYDYLQDGIRLIGSLSSGTQLWLTTEGEVLRVHQYLKGPGGLGRCVADVYTLVLTVETLRMLLGPAWSPGEVRLLSGDEGLLGDRSVLGDGLLLTGQHHSSFTIARSLTNLPIPARGAPASQSKAAQQDGGRPPMPVGLSDSIEQLVVSQLANGYPSIDAAAELAGMSPRTLQRRLAELGVTYSGLVLSIRTRQAKEMLTDTEMRIADIAAELGYTDSSNFGRAFRRRTGMSPLDFRRSQSLDRPVV